MKKTAWYPGEVKPVRVGVYQRKHLHGDKTFSYWSGEMWMFIGHSITRATQHRGLPSMSQYLPWRGLAEPPK